MSLGPIVFEKSGEKYLLRQCTENDKMFRTGLQWCSIQHAKLDFIGENGHLTDILILITANYFKLKNIIEIRNMSTFLFG